MLRVTLNEVNYIDVSPEQSIGVLASLIPFLEPNAAYRGVVGSNVQHQAVSLIQPQSPYVGTGMGNKVVRDSEAVVLVKNNGVVGQVSAAEIIVRTDAITRVEGGKQSSAEMGYDIYQLQNFQRSNNDTCIHQNLFAAGQRIEADQVIADGAVTQGRELALERNVLVAFMP